MTVLTGIQIFFAGWFCGHLFCGIMVRRSIACGLNWDGSPKEATDD